LLYAGTEFGMFISFDNGSHWQAFQLNLPNVPVSDIKVFHDDLIVSTQGRAIWILDNVTSLHQLAVSSKIDEARLFKPRAGYRTRTAAANLGPMIEYYLPENSVQPVTIEILDSKGLLVNSYSSETSSRPGRPPATAGMPGARNAGPESQPEDADAGPTRRIAPPPRVTKTPGINRFVWDVRHQQGPVMPPGDYQARLKVGTTIAAESFTVLIDPRVADEGITTADLQQQFEHNMRMRAMVTTVNQLVSRVRAAQSKLKDSQDEATRTALNAAASKLLTEPVRYGKPGLQAHITYLASMTATTDQKIGHDAAERYEILRKELESLKVEVDRLLGPAPATQSSLVQ